MEDKGGFFYKLIKERVLLYFLKLHFKYIFEKVPNIRINFFSLITNFSLNLKILIVLHKKQFLLFGKRIRSELNFKHHMIGILKKN